MRAFRIKQINPHTKRQVNVRDYIGIEKLKKHGFDTYDRYKRQLVWSFVHGNSKTRENYIATISEKLDGKWVKLSDDEITNLRNYTDDITADWLREKGFDEHQSLLSRSFSKDISLYNEEYKVITVLVDPGNVYVYLRQGDLKSPREDDDLITVFNGDRQGKLTKNFLEDLYFLLKRKKL